MVRRLATILQWCVIGRLRLAARGYAYICRLDILDNAAHAVRWTRSLGFLHHALLSVLFFYVPIRLLSWTLPSSTGDVQYILHTLFFQQRHHPSFILLRSALRVSDVQLPDFSSLAVGILIGETLGRHAEGAGPKNTVDRHGDEAANGWALLWKFLVWLLNWTAVVVRYQCLTPMLLTNFNPMTLTYVITPPFPLE